MLFLLSPESLKNVLLNDSNLVIISVLSKQMKRFDYEKIYLLSLGESTLLLRYFKECSIGGNNYIKRPGIVTENPLGLSNQHLAEYLGLCSLRKYPDSHLPLDYLPKWVPLSVVQENPLVRINQNSRTIMFIYEGN